MARPRWGIRRNCGWSCPNPDRENEEKHHDSNPYGSMALQDDNVEDWFNDYDSNDWAVDTDYANALDDIYGDFNFEE